MDFENEEAAVVADVARLGADDLSLGHGFQVVHFDAGADADVARG